MEGSSDEGVTAGPALRVLIADTRTEVRAALRLLLEHTLVHMTVDEAGDAEMLLARAALARPDVVLLDWELSGLRITAFLPALRLICPRGKVIALSSRFTPAEAERAGVDGVISTTDPPEQVVETIGRVVGPSFRPPTA
jgi:DNA-binding NarL/FixJ family response regulator